MRTRQLPAVLVLMAIGISAVGGVLAPPTARAGLPFSVILPTVNRSYSGPDCMSYDSSSLQVVDNGADGWLLTDGTVVLHKLNNQLDAQRARALAQRYYSLCFIGRGNARPSPVDYIVEYWNGNTGVQTTIDSPDCLPYDPAALVLLNLGAQGWLLAERISSTNYHAMVTLDNEVDAQSALSLAMQYRNECFIGRDNTRPDRKAYIVRYWEN